ncbi:hypothetical protein H9Q13_00610 [Pontibacter sp. JH31]|uniref:Uncharacterized protein n=1 Tax=Pontibacter aquaedesilientis TaxID=2766980 RepID=A0ABR7XDH3_9BACT|nr:hypothetical protein [Pontibacter aquaedesilientis]MBD1395653.1 hypothetical protein [Pontibacter aquaedesilientis]
MIVTYHWQHCRIYSHAGYEGIALAQCTTDDFVLGVGALDKERSASLERLDFFAYWG